MKNRIYLMFYFVVLLLTGCVNEVHLDKDVLPDSTTEYISEYVTQESTESTTEETTNYFDVDVLADEVPMNMVYSIERIEVPVNAEFRSCFLYENLIFYTYDYKNYFMKQENTNNEEALENEKVSDSEYATNILVLNTDTGENKLIHSISNVTTYIIDIEYNGRYLMWSEYTDREVCVKVLDMKTQEQTNVALGLVSGFTHVKLTDEYIFWTSAKNINTNVTEYYMCRYDLETKHTKEMTQITSTNFNVETSQNVITVCCLDENTTIKGYDFDGKLLYNYETDGYVTDAYCNSYGVVWMRGTELLFYEAKSEKIYNMGDVSMFVMVGDCVVMSKGFDGIYSYKLGSETQNCIAKGDNQVVIGLNTDTNGDVHGKWTTPMQTFTNSSTDVIMLKVSQSIKLN